MESFWMNNGAPDVSHYIFALYFAFAFVAARFILDKFVFQKLAVWLLSRGTTRLRLDEATTKSISKCTESTWKLIYYTTIEFLLLKTACHEPWFIDSKQYFVGWPHQELKVSLKLIYMCQCGFYIYSIVALLLWEIRRKDFSILMCHHVVTVLLIAFSYITRLFRAGAVTLALHDASDILLEAAKLCRYSGNEVGASTFFGLFALSWLVLRLIFFPFWVLWSSSYYIILSIDLSNSHNKGIYYFSNTMLFTLLFFHIYWGKLILVMILKQLRNWGRVGDDIRSDSEDDD